MEERFFYLNREPHTDGFHYIHAYECKHKPALLFQVKLGFFFQKERLLQEAKKYFSKVKLCDQCCPPDKKRSPRFKSFFTPVGKKDKNLPIY